MRIFHFFLIFVFFFLSSIIFARYTIAESCPNLNQNPCWISKQPMQIPRWSIGAAVDSVGNIYVVGGYDGNGYAFKNLEIYNPISDTWTSKASAPKGLIFPGFTYSSATGKFYMAGGFDTVSTKNDVYEYDPVTDTWTSKNPIPIALQQFKFIEAKNGKLYAVGGNSTNECPGKIYEYDPIINVWNYKTTMPFRRCDPAVAIDSDGLIYTIGGLSSDGIQQTNIVEVYNISTNTWSTKSAMLINRINIAGSASFNAQNKIYVVGGASGSNSNQQINRVDEYDPISNSWALKTPIPIGKDEFQLIRSGEKVYAIGGRSSDSPEIATGTNFEGFLAETINQNINLSVPLLKQTSKPWKSNKYDSANKWNPKDTSINSWGCALTSAAMVFKYHGINKLPNNKVLDPGSLNNWLNSQKDGYVGTGWVNWIALSRLSKESTIINNISSFHALEFSRKNLSDVETVKEDLSNNLPDILGVPGHFIVATGIENDVIKINDPAYDRVSLSDYGNTFNTIGKFTPSHTDLSYIMLTTDLNINVELKNENGDTLGDSYIQEPIINPFNPNQTNESLKILYLQKPTDTNFNISVFSSNDDKKYDLKLYLYDRDGKVFTKSYKGTLTPEETKTIPFTFDGSSTLYPKKVTYASTGIDIEKAWKQNLIKDKDTRNLLHETLVKALVQSVMKDDEGEIIYLIKFENILNENNGTKILSPAYETLLYDINYLSTHL